MKRCFKSKVEENKTYLELTVSCSNLQLNKFYSVNLTL